MYRIVCTPVLVLITTLHENVVFRGFWKHDTYTKFLTIHENTYTIFKITDILYRLNIGLTVICIQYMYKIPKIYSYL